MLFAVLDPIILLWYHYVLGSSRKTRANANLVKVLLPYAEATGTMSDKCCAEAAVSTQAGMNRRK
jgi:hypothetical protein